MSAHDIPSEVLFFGTVAAASITLVLAAAGTYMDRKRAKEHAAYLAFIKYLLERHKKTS